MAARVHDAIATERAVDVPPPPAPAAPARESPRTEAPRVARASRTPRAAPAAPAQAAPDRRSVARTGGLHRDGLRRRLQAPPTPAARPRAGARAAHASLGKRRARRNRRWRGWTAKPRPRGVARPGRVELSLAVRGGRAAGRRADRRPPRDRTGRWPRRAGRRRGGSWVRIRGRGAALRPGDPLRAGARRRGAAHDDRLTAHSSPLLPMIPAMRKRALVGLLAATVLASTGCHRHTAGAADCAAVLDRLVELELNESGYHDPVLRSRWQRDLARRFAPDLARCRGLTVRNDLAKCLPAARSSRRSRIDVSSDERRHSNRKTATERLGGRICRCRSGEQTEQRVPEVSARLLAQRPSVVVDPAPIAE